MTDERIIELARAAGISDDMIHLWKRDPESLAVIRTTRLSVFGEKLLVFARAVTRDTHNTGRVDR